MGSPANSVITGRTIGRSGTPLLARVRLPSTGALVTRAALAGITYVVRDLTTDTQAGTGTLTVASVVYDTLQTADPRWQADSADEPGPDGSYGYNVAWTVPASLLAWTPAVERQAGVPHRFRVDLAFSPVSGEPFTVPFEFSAVPVWGA